MNVEKNARVSSLAMLLFSTGAGVVLIVLGPSAVFRIKTEPLFSSEMLASSFLIFVLSISSVVLIAMSYLLWKRMLFKVVEVQPLTLSGRENLYLTLNGKEQILFRFNKDLLGEDTHPILIKSADGWYLCAEQASYHLRSISNRSQ